MDGDGRGQATPSCKADGDADGWHGGEMGEGPPAELGAWCHDARPMMALGGP